MRGTYLFISCIDMRKPGASSSLHTNGVIYLISGSSNGHLGQMLINFLNISPILLQNIQPQFNMKTAIFLHIKLLKLHLDLK